MTAYQQAAQAFIADHGCTPMDVMRAPSEFPFETQARAAYLDAWDIWLFAQEADE